MSSEAWHGAALMEVYIYICIVTSGMGEFWSIDLHVPWNYVCCLRVHIYKHACIALYGLLFMDCFDMDCYRIGYTHDNMIGKRKDCHSSNYLASALNSTGSVQRAQMKKKKYIYIYIIV